MSANKNLFKGYCPFSDEDCIHSDLTNDTDCDECSVYTDCDDPSSAELFYAMGLKGETNG